MRHLFLILAVSGTVALAGVATAAMSVGPTEGAAQVQAGVKLAQQKRSCPKGTRWDQRNKMCAPAS